MLDDQGSRRALLVHGARWALHTAASSSLFATISTIFLISFFLRKVRNKNTYFFLTLQQRRCVLLLYAAAASVSECLFKVTLLQACQGHTQFFFLIFDSIYTSVITVSVPCLSQ